MGFFFFFLKVRGKVPINNCINKEEFLQSSKCTRNAHKLFFFFFLRKNKTNCYVSIISYSPTTVLLSNNING